MLGKCRFTIFWNEKTLFPAIKTTSSKTLKIDIFPQGLTHGFGPKMVIFPTFFLGNAGQENVFYETLERKNAFLGYKNKKFKNSKNWHFSKGVNSWFGSKNGHFSDFYFLGNIGQENVVYDILERKNTFLGYKNNNFKNSKKWYFFKGVNPSFWYKSGHFSNFHFLGNTGRENVFYDILEQKNAFLGYKNKKFKNTKKIDIFPNWLTHGFCPKMATFPTLVSKKIYARKKSFRIFLNKKRPF